MKRKLKINIIIISVLVVAIFSLTVVSSKKEETIKTNGAATSDTKIEWGIKRNDNHEQPDVGGSNKKILEENGGVCLGNKEKKYIYLTFDAGYEAGYTSEILKVLKENEVSATFFITAHYLNTEPDLVKQMLEDGHLVGNQSPHTLMEL